MAVDTSRSPDTLVLAPGEAELADLRLPLRGPVEVELQGGARERVVAGQRTIQGAVDRGEIVYGVNTGFGKLANKRISPEDIEELQRRLIRSHMTGVGEPFADEIVRLTMVLKVLCLGQGHSGVRLEVVDALMALINADVIPRVPSQGSVGASGDLAPLSHLAGVLTGLGEAKVGGQWVSAADALRHVGLEPLTLAPKEGVALINGTQASTALALAGLFRAEAVLTAALGAGALSLEAVAGTNVPFDPRIQRIRRQAGQIEVGAALASLTAGTPIRAADMPGRRLQDPYSFRCMPQVMGAARDLLQFAATTLAREANSVSDNPLIFPDDGAILSGGNFHGQPVAYAADIIAMALCEIGSLSERRCAMMVDASISGLPPFLVGEAGLNSGFMLAQVTAAALVSENKSLAHPCSIDSIPTAANQEDHVSMATHAGRRLHLMTANAAGVIAVELMAAAQGVDLQEPSQPALGAGQVYRLVRERVPFMDQDRVLAGEIEEVTALVLDGAFSGLVPLEPLRG